MSGLDLAGLLKVGIDILTTTVDKVTGKILAQVGSVTEQTTDGDNIEQWQHVGFASRAAKPDAGKKAAQYVLMSAGDHDIAIASQDTRHLDRYGNIDFGETILYAVGPDGTAQARVMLKKDGSLTFFTTATNTAAGQSVYFRTKPDGFEWIAPWGTMKFDSTGFHILHASGASYDLGGVGGLPSPLDVISSYARTEAGTIVDTCSGAPIADATATATSITALQAQITALQLEIVALQLVFTTLATKGDLNGIADVAPLTGALGAVVVASTVSIVASTATVGVQTPLIPKSSTAT